MPEHPTRLTNVEIRDLFHAALGSEEAGAAWVPPDPVELAPFFPAYEIQALISRGGMGAVYRARQLSLDRVVAIKLLPFHLCVREDFAERFRREAAALAKLNHPNIVSVHDFGHADDGHFFMVMEFVEGSDLAMRLRTGGPLPPDEALGIVRQVCDALHYAHQQGVVHRDIKPANILLQPAGRVKVSDFGIAQFAHEEAAGNLTLTGTLLGTPDYTAPEQLVQKGPVDQRADIFSVAVMLYEMLTGQLPRGVFRPVSEFVPAARRLDAVLTRAMQSEPDRRYPAVIDLSAELVRAVPARRQVATRWAAIAALLALLSAFALDSWPQRTEHTERTQGSQRTLPPFTNSLGLTFVPAGTPGVLFCTTEARVRDFEAFDRARGSVPEESIYVNYDGTQNGWVMKPATWRSPTFAQTPDHPVVGVTHFEAVAFCDWLTQHERASGRINPADRYRLPTDTEWSLAAGLDADAHNPAGTYAWGGDWPPPADAGNFAGEELREDALFEQFPVIAGHRDPHRFTAPVASYPPNRYGLHDIGGNVVEWLYSEGSGPATMRDASWWEVPASTLDAGFRRTLSKSVRSFTLGFRIVLERASTPTEEP
jgi:serine/threonine protein kinase